MSDNQKKKRKAINIQDMAYMDTYDDRSRGGSGSRSSSLRSAGSRGSASRGMESRSRGYESRPYESRPRSSYSGPKKSPAGSSSQPSSRSIEEFDRERKTGSSYVNTIDGYGYSGGSKQNGGSSKGYTGGYVAPVRGGGMADYAWIAYSAVLALCLMTALIAFSKNAGSDGTVYYPRNLLTVNGVMDQIYEEYLAGDLGRAYANEVNSANQDPGMAQIGVTGNETVLGTVSSLPNATTGAAMTLDTGESASEFPAATSHEEVVKQLDEALAKGDAEFVGKKLAYEDETTGTLLGYPPSVVTHFTETLALDESKRQLFISEIGDEKYTAKNGNAFIVKLPLLKFTVNVGYDDTTLSISGFSDQHLNKGQSAVVQPILPCMYTISISTNGRSQTSDVEANMSEGNLEINIGVSN